MKHENHASIEQISGVAHHAETVPPQSLNYPGFVAYTQIVADQPHQAFLRRVRYEVTAGGAASRLQAELTNFSMVDCGSKR